MKIKTKNITLEELYKIKTPKHKKPLKPLWILGALIRLISIPELWAVKFKYTTKRIDKANGLALF